MITFYSVKKLRTLSTMVIHTDRVEINERTLIPRPTDYISYASNMGMPAFWYSDIVSDGMTLYDWHNGTIVGEPVPFAGRPSILDCFRIRIHSAAVVAGNTIAIGHYERGWRSPILLTPNGEVFMYNLAYVNNISVERTGQRMYICNVNKLDSFMPYGEEIPFAWWLPKHHCIGAAAFENMFACTPGPYYCTNVQLTDVRTEDTIILNDIQRDGQLAVRCTFTCDHVLSVCIERSCYNRRQFSTELRVYDLRNLGAFYDAHVADYEVIRNGAVAFCARSGLRYTPWISPRYARPSPLRSTTTILAQLGSRVRSLRVALRTYGPRSAPLIPLHFVPLHSPR